jgi:transposase InsO family protein
MTKELLAQALFRAVQPKQPAPGLIHLLDHGSQYCASR